MPGFDFNAFGSGFPAGSFKESIVHARDRDESYTNLFELELLPGNIGYAYATDLGVYYPQFLEITGIGTFLSDWHLIDSPPEGLTVAPYDANHLSITGTPTGEPGYHEFAVQTRLNGHNSARYVYRMWIGQPLSVVGGAQFSGILLHQSSGPFFGTPPYIARGIMNDGYQVGLYDSLLTDSPKDLVYRVGLGLAEVTYRKTGASPVGTYDFLTEGGEGTPYPATVVVTLV